MCSRVALPAPASCGSQSDPRSGSATVAEPRCRTRPFPHARRAARVDALHRRHGSKHDPSLVPPGDSIGLARRRRQGLRQEMDRRAASRNRRIDSKVTRAHQNAVTDKPAVKRAEASVSPWGQWRAHRRIVSRLVRLTTSSPERIIPGLVRLRSSVG